MKKVIALFLSVVISMTMILPVCGASDEAITAANKLYELGLFKGTGTDENGAPIFELDRAPTRHEAVTMLVRLLGKDEEAKNGKWNIPFTDVADWAKPYVGYAYANGLTSGTSATTFGGDAKVSATQYLTFVLRSLGYTSGTDFEWDKAWLLSDKLGITDGRYGADSEFTRGDVAIISYNALSAPKKPILENLIYEDKYVAIQYSGLTTEVPKGFSSVSSYCLKFKVSNKGTANRNGKEFSDIWITATDVSLEGYQTSRNMLGSSGGVVSSGENLEIGVSINTDANLSDGLSCISAVFRLRFGNYSGNDFAFNVSVDNLFTGDGFYVVDETTIFTGSVPLNGGDVVKTAPVHSYGSLVYSDDNIDLYFGGHDILISYSIRNKSNQLVTLDCKSISVMGEVSEPTFLLSNYEYQVVLPYSLCHVTLAGVPTVDGVASSVGIVLDVTVGDKEYTVTVEDPYKPISSADYAYLAGNDFCGVRRTYSNAVANCAYVYAYKDLNGDLCVLTYVSYKIQTNWDKYTLHNLTKGTTIDDPSDYYLNAADRYYGASKILYMDLASEVLKHQYNMLSAMSNVLKGGENTFDGVFVDAATLNM